MGLRLLSLQKQPGANQSCACSGYMQRMVWVCFMAVFPPLRGCCRYVHRACYGWIMTDICGDIASREHASLVLPRGNKENNIRWHYARPKSTAEQTETGATERYKDQGPKRYLDHPTAAALVVYRIHPIHIEYHACWVILLAFIHYLGWCVRGGGHPTSECYNWEV